MRGLAIAASLLITTAGAWAAESAQERLDRSARVFSEVMSAPDKSIPQDLLNKAQCVVILPGLKKAAFVVGGEFGRGFAECRNANGTGWAAPAAMRFEGGSVGFQIGGESADIVMLVMNRHGMDKLLQDKVTIGADISAAAGPVGRTAAANTDLKASAEMLTYSRAKGLFGGISLNGATLRPDTKENAQLYGRDLGTRDIVMGNIAPPAAAHPLIAELDRYSSMSNADRSKQ
jgi:lipid-binding SYLF domain-containing protein